MKDESKTELPKKIYGYWNNDGGPDDEFLQTGASEASMVDVNEERRVGIYELTGYAIIKNVTTTSTEATINPV